MTITIIAAASVPNAHLKPWLLSGDYGVSAMPGDIRRTTQPPPNSRAAAARTARNRASGMSPSADRLLIIQPSPH